MCVQAGQSCLNCLLSKRGRCSNHPTTEQASSDCVVGNTSHTRVSVDLPPPDGEMFNSTPTVPELVRSHFQNAFGAPLLHSEGGHMSMYGVSCGCVLFHLEIVIMICPMELLVMILLSYFIRSFFAC